MVLAARPGTAQGPIPGEAGALAAYRAAMAGTPLPTEAPKPTRAPKERSLVFGRVPVKLAAAGALVLAGGTAAAAATGSLPGPVQSTVSSALHHVGISVPSSSGPVVNPHPSANASPHAFAGSNNSLYGLCTAYASHGSTGSQAAVPSRLSSAATSAGETITQFCSSIPNPSNANPASSPSAHKSDEAGTVHGNTQGSGGPAGPGGAGTHNGTPGPPADHSNTPTTEAGPPHGTGKGTGQTQGQGHQDTATTSTTTSTSTSTTTTTSTIPTTTTTTVKGNNGGGGHSSGDTSHGASKK